MRGARDSAQLAPLTANNSSRRRPASGIRRQHSQASYNDENAGNAIISGMFTAFAVIALMIAAAGQEAVMSYSLSQRRQEIGIRKRLSDIGRQSHSGEIEPG